MSGKFAGKIVVISGASRGIGQGIAEAFAAEGAQTVMTASSQANLDAAAAKILAASGAKPLVVAADLRTAAGCEQVFRTVEKAYGRCDVLINSAGATQAGNFLEQTDAVWQDGFDLKFFACVRLCRWFWPMLKAAEGFIVNIDGGMARQPIATYLVGGSVNAAMANFSKGLAGLGKQDGVNVNVIHPGATQTDRSDRMLTQRAKAQGMEPAALRAKELAARGSRRIGQPQDIAALTLFLCTEAARHVQGTQIAVDGGDTLGVF